MANAPLSLLPTSPNRRKRASRGDNLNRSLLMAGLGMMAEGGRPGATAMGAIGRGGQQGIGLFERLEDRDIALEQRDELMDIKRSAIMADLLKAGRPDIQLYDAGNGKVYWYDKKSQSPTLTAVPGVDGKVEGGVFEKMLRRMVDAGHITEEKAMTLRTDYVKTLASGKGNTVNVNMGDSKAFQKVQATYYDMTRGQANNAKEALGTVDDMEAALKKLKRSGPLTEAIAPLNAFAKELEIDTADLFTSLGINANDAADEQSVQRLTSELALRIGKELLKGQGAVTNYERKEVRRLAAQLGKSPEANAAAIKGMRRLLGRRVEKFKVMDKWLNGWRPEDFEGPQPKSGEQSIMGFESYWLDNEGKHLPVIEETAPVPLAQQEFPEGTGQALVDKFGPDVAKEILEILQRSQ